MKFPVHLKFKPKGLHSNTAVRNQHFNFLTSNLVLTALKILSNHNIKWQFNKDHGCPKPM